MHGDKKLGLPKNLIFNYLCDVGLKPYYYTPIVIKLVYTLFLI